MCYAKINEYIQDLENDKEIKDKNQISNWLKELRELKYNSKYE